MHFSPSHSLVLYSVLLGSWTVLCPAVPSDATIQGTLDIKNAIKTTYHPLEPPRLIPKGPGALDLPLHEQPNLLTIGRNSEAELTERQKALQFGRSWAKGGEWCAKLWHGIQKRVILPVIMLFHKLTTPFNKNKKLTEEESKLLQDAMRRKIISPDIFEPAKAEQGPHTLNHRPAPDNPKHQQASVNPEHQPASDNPKYQPAANNPERQPASDSTNHQPASSSPKPADPALAPGSSFPNSGNDPGASHAQHSEENDKNSRPRS